MCLNPVKILNPKLAWTPSDPMYLIVQCNRCFECRARKQQEWFVRSYYEWLRFKDKGSVWNFTLTFNNDHLPHYEDKRNYILHRTVSKYNYGDTVGYRSVVDRLPSNCVNYSFDCFDSNKVTTFLKLFRQNLSRKYPKLDTSGIKYILCCEYGEHTHRPHLHGNLFIPFKFPVSVFRQIICRSWTNGFVGASKKGFLVNSVSALEYTCKYVSKDLYFFDHVISDYLDKSNLDSVEYEYRYQRVKDNLPKLRVSNGFGSGLASEVLSQSDDVSWLLHDRPISIPAKNGRNRNFAIPRYVIQKLIKSVDKSISKALDRPYLVYTELGVRYRLAQFKKCVNTDVEEFRFIRKCLSETKYNEFRYKNLATSLAKILDSINFEDLSYYRNFLRYLPVDQLGDHHHYSWYLRRKDSLLSRYFRNVAIPDISDYLSCCQYTPSDVGVHLIRGFPLKSFERSDIKLLSDLSTFQVFEHASRLIDDLYIHDSSLRSSRRKQKDDDSKSIRSAVIEFVLYDLHTHHLCTTKIY